MKNKKVILTSISFILVLTIIIVYSNKEEDTSFQDNNTKQVVQENTLSMMIEQTAGAGDYKLETRSSWPTSGYTFNTTLSKCENGSTLSWDSTNGIVTMTGNVSDKCYVYFDIYNPTLAEYIVDLYTTQGANGLYHHDGSLENGISDGSYRYAGASSSVNNYVCFGSTADTCPDDNKYRIIGVFGDQVKLIKATSVGDMAWDSNVSNIWSTSSLNTYLNGDYLTGLTTTWSNKIATTTWKVAGNTYSNIYSVVPKTAYTNEITSPNKGSNGTEDTYSAKIGLMYVSDYGLAADPSAWTTTLVFYNGSVNGSTIKSLNWMYLGMDEWTISRSAGSPDYAFFVNSDGNVFNYYVDHSYAVRPVFYLTSSITYVRGDGTASNPYVIN